MERTRARKTMKRIKVNLSPILWGAEFHYIRRILHSTNFNYEVRIVVETNHCGSVEGPWGDGSRSGLRR